MASGVYESVLFELNQCRCNPSKYSSKLSNILKYYKGKIYEKPGYPAIETEEGPENVQACIKYLKSVRPAAPLEWSDALSKAAQYHVDDIGPKGLMGHDSSDGQDAAYRVEQYGQWSGQLGENIDYGNCEGEDIVVSLLIDDGVLARGQRLNIMKREHVYVGIGFGYHAEYEYVCTIVFAEVFIENPSTPPKIEAGRKEEEKSSSRSMNKSKSRSAYETFDATGYIREGLEDKDVKEIKEFFDHLDYENSGAVDCTEIKAVFDNQDFDVTNNSVLGMLAGLNIEDMGKIDFDEFVELVSEEVVKGTKKKAKDTKAYEKTERVQRYEEKKVEKVSKVEGKKTAQRYEEPKRPGNAKPDRAEVEKKSKPAFDASDWPHLTPADISQIKEVFDAYDSECLGWINLEELVTQIKENDYEEGIIEIIDVMLSLELKNKRKVTFNQLLDMLEFKIAKLTKSPPKASSKFSSSSEVMYTKTTTTKISSDGQKITTTSTKTVTKAAPKVKPFDPNDYARPGLTEEEICEIKDAFDLFDTEKNGTIETRDLKNAMESQGFQLKSPTIFKMVCEMDVEGHGRVDFEEFLDMMSEDNNDENSAEEVRKLFNLFDIDQSGFIELKNLKQIAKELGETLNEEEIIDLITKSDTDGDGKVSFQEFYDIMSRTVN